MYLWGGLLKGRHHEKASLWCRTQRQIKIQPFPLDSHHETSETVWRARLWIGPAYWMSTTCQLWHLERASGWHLSVHQVWPWHFMYHVELLGGKRERGKFTYQWRQMNIAYWSAHEPSCSGPAALFQWHRKSSRFVLFIVNQRLSEAVILDLALSFDLQLGNTCQRQVCKIWCHVFNS